MKPPSIFSPLDVDHPFCPAASYAAASVPTDAFPSSKLTINMAFFAPTSQFPTK